MAEYLPLYDEGDTITRTTSAAVIGGQLIRVSGDKTVAPVSAASADWLGVAGHDAASGEPVTVYPTGIQRIVASGAITAGSTVEGAGTGKVAAHTNGTNDVNIVGLALSTAADGALVEVSLLR